MATNARIGTAWLCWTVLVWLPCLGAAPLAIAQGGGSKPEVNTVKSLKHTSPDVIEIELHSSTEFPVRNEIATLRIGNKEFKKSRYPDDGSLETLIFVIDKADFERLPDGAAIEVGYGKPENGGHRWQFGRLNKASLR